MAGSLKPRSQSDAVRNVQTLSSEKISREIPEKISATMDERYCNIRKLMKRRDLALKIFVKTRRDTDLNVCVNFI